MKRILSALVLLIADCSVHAQGIYIYKTDGTLLKMANAEVDSIIAVNDYAPEPEAVDLGLSVKWASFNIGAKAPTDFGSAFRWGETVEYSNARDYSLEGMTYTELMTQGIIDSNGNLTSKYDAATVIWGTKWRMPTDSEIEELYEKCSWKKVFKDNYEGYLEFTGSNGNKILLPASHYYKTAEETTSEDFLFGEFWGASTRNYSSGNFSSVISVFDIIGSNDKYGGSIRDRDMYAYYIRPVSE